MLAWSQQVCISCISQWLLKSGHFLCQATENTSGLLDEFVTSNIQRLRISNSRRAIGVDTKLTFSLVDNLILWASCRFCQNLAKSGQIRELNLNDRRVSGILERKTTFWGVLGWGRHKLQHHKSREILTYTYTWYSTYLRCYGSDMAMASETWRYVAIKKLYINGLFQSSWKVIFPWDKTYFL